MLRYFKKSFYRDYSPHYWPNLKLALPAILSQAGHMVVGLADTFMVAQLGTTELAAVSFANNIFTVGLVLNIGLAIGITPMVGKAHGAKKVNKCGYWLKQGLVANVIFAVLQVILMIGIAFVMPFMGQDAEVVEMATPYYLILVSSIIPLSLFLIVKQFAEGLANTRIAMIITLFSNIINIVFNYFLIFGKAGFPELGINGAGWATLLSRIIMPIVIIAVFMRLPFFGQYKKAFRKAKVHFKEVMAVIKVGLPIGGQMVIEVFAFAMGAIMMGWISKEAMAAHQIVITLASLTYMMSVGLSAAATIKVSNYYGQNDLINLKNSAYAIVHKVLVFMIFTAISFITLRNFLPKLFVDDPNVLTIAATLMIVTGFFQLFDGLQVAWIGALRGLEDVKMPTLFAFITWIVLTLPISYFCGFILNMGPLGIWIGYLFGLITGSMLLQFRFMYMFRKISKQALEKK